MKYAIYRGNRGTLYSKELLESAGEIKQYPYISESSLPVVVNNRGGYCGFNATEKDFVEVREVKCGDPLSLEEMFPKNAHDFNYGWISPEGDSYTTDDEDHCFASDFLCDAFGLKGSLGSESIIEEAGWIKVTFDLLERKIKVYSFKNEITQKQMDKLFDTGLLDFLNPVYYQHLIN